MTPKIAIAGVLGKMGKAAVETFLNSKDFELKLGLVRDLASVSQEKLQYFESNGIKLSDNLEAELQKGGIDILVELTTPDSVFKNTKIALRNGTRSVIGATGLSQEDISELTSLCSKNSLGTIIAPNFAIGAILMMKFAASAAKYFDNYEIIEMHHDQKVDSPSGTALKTAKMIQEYAQKPNQAPFKEQAARGETHSDVPVHSIRLPGLVANQEVIFGSQGQTLSICHNTIDRTSFMPGIVFACKEVMKLDKLIYGLEKLI